MPCLFCKVIVGFLLGIWPNGFFLMEQALDTVLAGFYVNLRQARVIRDEGNSVEEMST